MSPWLLLLRHTLRHRATYVCVWCFYTYGVLFTSKAPALPSGCLGQTTTSPLSQARPWTLARQPRGRAGAGPVDRLMRLLFAYPWSSPSPFPSLLTDSPDLPRLVLSSNGWWAMDTRPTSGKTVAPLHWATSNTVSHHQQTVRMIFCFTGSS